ncbi:hypothetical protein [Pandoraea sputorum]|uniref:Uncharacterized protein n=1 Tax=Pandoraea sputorum TaxID=93222 RepID=A0A5E5BHC0_9BURK|nr:hypothetical protein [Pandoraea sputorum]VVE84425.1 hypothetical protein PSP31121_04756 [Pandoraea sputorum]
MPTPLATRPFQSARPMDQVLNTSLGLFARDHKAMSAVCDTLEARYFAPPADQLQAGRPILLSIGGLPLALALPDVTSAPAGQRGRALRDHLSTEIGQVLVNHGVAPDIAYVQARDLASYLACQELLTAPDLLGPTDPHEGLHQQAIDVSMDGTDVFFHITTTYQAAGQAAAPDAPAGPAALTRVTDMRVKFTVGSHWTSQRLSQAASQTTAEVTQAAVRVSTQPQHLDRLSGVRQRLGVPDAPHAPGWLSGRVSRLLAHCSAAFGGRGTKFIERAPGPLDPAGVARPGGMGLDLTAFDKSSQLISAEPGHGRWTHVVAQYHNDGGIVACNGREFDAETLKSIGDARAAPQAARLKLGGAVTFGQEDGTGGARAPLPQFLYRFGTEYLAQVARTDKDAIDAAVAGGATAAEATAAVEAKQVAALESALGDELFELSGRQRYAAPLITLGATDLMANLDAAEQALDAYAKALRRAVWLAERQQNKATISDAIAKSIEEEAASWGMAYGHAALPLDEQVAFVKRQLGANMLRRLTTAIDDVATRQQLCRVLLHEKAVTEVLTGADGGPRFSTETRKPRRIHIDPMPAHTPSAAGTVRITFESDYDTLRDTRAKVSLGAETLETLHRGVMATKTTFVLTGTAATLRYAAYDAQLES